LLELQSLQPVDGNFSQINSIRGQASRIFHDVQQFLSSIAKFNDTLGTRAARGFHHGTFAKLKWSQLVAPKVKELRETVHLQVANVQTLLSLLIQHNQISDRALLTRTLTQQSLSLDSLAEKVKSLESSLRQNRRPADEIVVRAFQHSRTPNKITVNKTSIKDDESRADVVSHRPAPSSGSPSSPPEQTAVTIITRNSEGNRATSDDLRKLEVSCLADKVPGSGQRPPFRMEEISFLRLNLSASVSTENFWAIFFYLSAKADAILQHLVGFRFVALKEMLLSLLQVLFFFKVLRQIPRTVSLVVEDNIRFEDALGRIQSLQYQHFKHWAVLEACLRCTFTNTPGMQKVRQGQFVLISPGVAGEVLDATNWEKYASPGMVVTMSISISTILTPRGCCPRGCVAGRTAVLDFEFHCTACDLTFSVKHAPKEDIDRTMAFIGARSVPRVVRDLRIRIRPEIHQVNSQQWSNGQRRESAASRLRAQSTIDRAEVPRLMRYESVQKEKEEHRLEMEEITHFKRVQLVEDTVLKWTWVFGHPNKPWAWAWYVELPEVRAEWKTAHFWKTLSGYRRPTAETLASLNAERRAFGLSRDEQDSLQSFKRTYTLTYTGSLSLNDNTLAVSKIPFIHLLATRPFRPCDLRRTLVMAKYMCDQLITIFAKDCPSDPEKKELLEVAYKELDVWGFPYHKETRRQEAIENSIVAFDALGIDPHDDLWQLLLPADERGKGICLSKRKGG
jgi:hypothetical protein